MATGGLGVTFVPSLLAVPFRERSRGRAVQLLNEAETRSLHQLGELVRIPKGAVAYEASEPATSTFNIVQGVIKTFRLVSGTKPHVTNFYFHGDLFGLAEQGRYFETAEAVGPVVAYKLPLAGLEELLAANGALAVRFLCKLAADLRRKHYHGLILDRHDAIGKVAMFLTMLHAMRQPQGRDGSTHFPMRRIDVADYVGLTSEAVSRAFGALERERIVEFVDRNHFHVRRPEMLQALSDDKTTL
jgi:CRP/FNR family transcriptional regulator